MNFFGKKEPLFRRNIVAIGIKLSSPDKILERSHGEVTKPETINYRSFKPEKDGLFCEKIFGPVRDWECHCGKYKRIRYKGIVCDRCGVEVTTKSVRRERMGHISLAVPIVHIWYWKSLPSKIGYILGISPKDLERITYYESYVVTSPGNSGLQRGDLLSEDDYFDIMSQQEAAENDDAENSEEDTFEAKIGGEAILELLKVTDVETLSKELRVVARTETSFQRKNDALKRLKVIEAFKKSDNRPEWMVMSVIPVIPPELRPLVPLEGGRFATSDLNDLYRRVIIRNNRLKKLMEIKAPEVILRNEKRMLQEAVDALFDNGRKAAAVRGDGNRPLKSLSDMLRGKQGRFRQNLLGKRIDYSGRSVIVVGPELKLHECGLPKDMALELFKPFVIRRLVANGYVKTVKSAKKMVDKRSPEVWDLLEDIIEDHPVLLNRAPTLHRLGIQAFQPVLVGGKAIQIHPLVCAAFNADFDGDQMAVHVPLSYYAQIETRMLMLSSHNILSPANGRPIAIPSQDIVLGLYYLTKRKSDAFGEGKMFYSKEEALIAYNNERISMHATIKVRTAPKEFLETTVGRILLNAILPEGFKYVNELLTKRRLEELVSEVIQRFGNYECAVFLDKMKKLGFETAMRSGATVGIEDVIVPDEKPVLLETANNKVVTIQNQYESGIITDGERYNKIIDIWTHTTSDVAEKMFERLSHDRKGFNPIFMMADSGARGSKEQIRQLAGMRGLMAKPQKKMTGQMGEIIENPITANFREGLSVLEYFISTHGARKGLADTALKTADAGYLTRRLVDVAQDVIISENDCGTILGLRIGDLKEGEEIIEPLQDRILGRTVAEDVYDPESGDIIVSAGDLIGEDEAERIANTGIETVYIRSVLTCESERGVCSKCYGRNLATGKPVGLGEAVGVMAAQSIGEPGTQLTLRTFHIGGTASRIAAQSQVVAKNDGKVTFENLKSVNQLDGSRVAVGRNARLKIIDENNRVLAQFVIPYGAIINAEEGQDVERGSVLFNWDPYTASIVSTVDGVVKYIDIKENVTMREELDDTTGLKQRVIIESRMRNLSPAIQVVDEDGTRISTYMIPTRSYLQVTDQQKVRAGEVLVKIPRRIAKTRDITGGLPRVAELFEARKPKEPAIVSEIDGTVRFGEIRRGVRRLIVTSRDGKDERTYLIPYGKHILVHDGDYVEAGEKLCEGSIAPHDILNILGPNKVQEYLVNEIQEVYRLQGVGINDKHIEVIVRQMLQKVRIDDPGDTEYLEGDQVDKIRFLHENEKIRQKIVVSKPGDSIFAEGEIVEKDDFDKELESLKKAEKELPGSRQAVPATFQPLLLGITKASLTTESFISAASFQETTRVLTDASIAGKKDFLHGLKENVIMGNLIPAGTGLPHYKRLRVRKKHIETDADGIEQAKEKVQSAAG